MQETIDFFGWLEYFADDILDERRRIITLLPERLEPHHQQILDYTREQDSITQHEYGDISPRSIASRKLDFEKLVRLNMIETKGVERSTYLFVDLLTRHSEEFLW